MSYKHQHNPYPSRVLRWSWVIDSIKKQHQHTFIKTAKPGIWICECGKTVISS